MNRREAEPTKSPVEEARAKSELSRQDREERLCRFLEDVAMRLDTHFINFFTEMRLQIRELEQENARMRKFYRAALISHERLLKVTSRQLLEKEIRQMSLEEEKRQALTRKHAKQHAWGRVRKETLNRD